VGGILVVIWPILKLRILSRENQQQIAGLTDWVKIVTGERGLWANTTAEPHWKLDETEGPYRVRFVASPARGTSRALTLRRKKLEPTFDHIINSKIDPKRRSGEAGDVEPDVESVINIEVPPWAESYELTSTETEGMCHCHNYRAVLIRIRPLGRR